MHFEEPRENIGTFLSNFRESRETSFEGLESLDPFNLLESLTDKHGEELSRRGIGLDLINCRKKKRNVPKIIIEIEDKEKFISYLKGLEKENLSGIESKLLDEIIKDLMDQLYDYDFKECSDRMITFLSSFEEIMVQYKRIGKKETAYFLERHLHPLKNGYLKEYINEEKETTNILFLSYKSYPPEEYERYCKKSLWALKRIMENPRAKELAFQVAKRIRGSLEHEKYCIINKEKGRYQEHLNIVNKAFQSLERMERELKEVDILLESFYKIRNTINLPDREGRSPNEIFSLFKEENSLAFEKRGIKSKLFREEDKELKIFRLKIGISIEDKESFFSYLKNLRKENLPDNESDLLSEIADNLIYQLLSTYNLDDPEDEEMLNFVSSLEKIISEYERIGKEEEASILKEFLPSLQGGYLKEYVKAKKRGFLNDGTISPFQYKILKPEEYREEWEENVREIRRMAKNSRAKDFLLIIIGNIRRILNYQSKKIKEDSSFREKELYLPQNEEAINCLEEIEKSLRL